MNPPIVRDPAGPAVARVLHVASGDLWAGAESQLCELLRALGREATIELRVALLNHGLLADRLRAVGVETFVLDEQKMSAWRIVRNLAATIRSWRPDVVHTHRRKEHLVGALAVTLARANARLVATIHGRTETGPRWWRPDDRALGAIVRRVLRSRFDVLIAVSDDLATYLRSISPRVRVIANGLDAEAVRGRAGGALPASDGRTVCFIGRLAPVKRVDRIIEAIALLLAEEPDRWSLFVVGDGPLRRDLEIAVESRGIGRRVHFLGFLANPVPVLAGADALVFASEHEGLPMSALEALAVGVPLVATPVGGLPDLIRASGAGQLADSASPADIAVALRAGIRPGNPGGSLPPSLLPVRHSVDTMTASYVQLYSAR